ncbi:MAG: IS256 family transposase [Bdellovibrionaceae bacterium]|nr:IS256 family transposase [Pseudobdellovibrionaceae bacterium]MCB9027082.1 IS256 family transposase [Pseudobdellovibrionaceae bacterium]MCB9027113.1 IS256 family transposase [Pseudobdellovibrionaceae bacterium]
MSDQSSEIARLMESPEMKDSLSKVKKFEDLSAPGGPMQLMIKLMAEGLMESERDHHLGYGHSERSKKSGTNSRNGFSSKKIKTSFGETEISVPRDRDGEFTPTLLEKYKRIDPDIERKIFSLYGKGMSTRDVTDVIAGIYGSDVSATLVSQITNRIKDSIADWQSRPLSSVYAVVFFDAIFFKSREDGKVINKASYTCYGINTHGDVDILGIWISNTEGSRFWLSVLDDLRSRGVEDILIACVDGLKGFPEAIENIFPKTEVQLCIVHQIRNSLKYVGSSAQREFILDLKTIYQATDIRAAELALTDFEEKWGSRYPSAVNPWRANWQHLSSYFKYPAEIRRMIYTTNIVENVHRQFRKVMKTKSSFPNDDALVKMLFLAIQSLLAKPRKKRGWPVIAGQLAIHFENRMT